ncbi:MAG: hypothetical protein UX99_C0008G0014 [Candidatus Amesbacteria bacterium GW2011_GWB1_47_26]|uniref:Uncharacterized protein n=1 Tax=Candidatus Amesbacteria bacterium GW2011_GWC2_45_19 TaxID=1618366 RepID=A0A0G1M4A2_9BACT|nr:MAG: hypothetical protein UX05_C0004G0038 [Candidatus Amesbacteria bacterium GW2011_GWC2_45_19]KKU38512.1 MAG: hypothetical protein UX52_C0005G0024 [Candidatus Amesbacteria bacterium GW2011_GWA1_46_35]KKU69199.1 MAG: hypothetical protein UX93_C0002G0038 [Microgenomates group bacterium GW2011_GWC1_47_20]KKU74680.1 MAG: hypothetical protein UX99_C0008G0014 [Candidatus Amesbacteria bacterium GW2011_GWB1_47_26]KKU80132.1 MAG: hypothetical protein UY06_C0005G0017 [Candidatus Amesbacteria bacteriu
MDDKIWLELAYWAREQGKSASMVAREWLAEKLTEKKSRKAKKKVNAARVFLEMAKRAEKFGLKGSRDSSTNDDYIYR